MSQEPSSSSSAFYHKHHNHFIAVNERGRLRRTWPMHDPSRPFSKAYQDPIDAACSRGTQHIVFFIHGGLNDLDGVVSRVERFDDNFRDEPWHLIHLAWDTSVISGIDDALGRFKGWNAWKNLYRAVKGFLYFRITVKRSQLRRPIAYFGETFWRSEYDTALRATAAPEGPGGDRENGFFRAFDYLNERARDNPQLRISFVVHSAGSMVANYLLMLISQRLEHLRARIHSYILLAPACHITHFEESVAVSRFEKAPVVMTLTPTLDREGRVGIDYFGLNNIYDQSLLWAIYELFEAQWKLEDFRRYGVPLKSSHDPQDLWNRSLLGLEEQVKTLSGSGQDSLDRTFQRGVAWAQSGQKVVIDGSDRVWTDARRHGAFADDPTTQESIKRLLSGSP